MGIFQFPDIFLSLDNEVVATWNMAADAISSYGREAEFFSFQRQRQFMESCTSEPVIGGV